MAALPARGDTSVTTPPISPASSTPTNDIIPPPAFRTRGKRVLVAFLEDDDTAVWTGIVQCDEFNVDYDVDGDPEVTLRFELTSEEDPKKSRRRGRSGSKLATGGLLPPATTRTTVSGPVSPGYLAAKPGARGDVLHATDGSTYCHDGTHWVLDAA